MLTMSTWSLRHMSALASAVWKASKQPAPQTMLLANFRIWFRCSLIMAGRTIDAIHTLSSTCSTRMCCSWRPSFGSASLMLSAAKHFMSHSFTKATICSLQRSRSCGGPFMTSSTQNNSLLRFLLCMKLVWKMSVFLQQFSFRMFFKV